MMLALQLYFGMGVIITLVDYIQYRDYYHGRKN